jgi:hypothetical protein
MVRRGVTLGDARQRIIAAALGLLLLGGHNFPRWAGQGYFHEVQKQFALSPQMEQKDSPFE